MSAMTMSAQLSYTLYVDSDLEIERVDAFEDGDLAFIVWRNYDEQKIYNLNAVTGTCTVSKDSSNWMVPDWPDYASYKGKTACFSHLVQGTSVWEGPSTR